MSQRQIHSSQQVALLAAGHFLNDFYCNFLPVLLPIIMPRTGLSIAMAGVLVLVMSITSNLLQPFFGYLMDRRNLAWLLTPVIPFGAVCICGIGFIESKAALFLLIALTGLSVSAFHPLGSSLVARASDPKRASRSMSYFVAGGNIGFAIAPSLIIAFADAISLFALPLLALPAFALAWLYARSGLPALRTASPRARGARAGSPSAGLAGILRDPDVLKLNLSMGLRCWTHVVISTFLPLLLVTNGYSKLLSGTLLSIFLAGCAAGGLAGGWLGDRISHKTLMIASLLLAIAPAAYALQCAAPEPLPMAALFLSGFFILAPQPASIVAAQRMMPENGGLASGMMLGLSFALGAAGTALTAALATFTGLSAAMLASVLPLAASAAITARIRFPDAGRSSRS